MDEHPLTVKNANSIRYYAEAHPSIVAILVFLICIMVGMFTPGYSIITEKPSSEEQYFGLVCAILMLFGLRYVFNSFARFQEPAILAKILHNAENNGNNPQHRHRHHRSRHQPEEGTRMKASLNHPQTSTRPASYRSLLLLTYTIVLGVATGFLLNLAQQYKPADAHGTRLSWLAVTMCAVTLISAILTGLAIIRERTVRVTDYGLWQATLNLPARQSIMYKISDALIAAVALYASVSTGLNIIQPDNTDRTGWLIILALDILALILTYVATWFTITGLKPDTETLRITETGTTLNDITFTVTTASKEEPQS